MSNNDFNNYNNGYNTPSPGPGPGNPGPNRSGGNRGGNDDWIETVSWIVDIGLIFAYFPIGLVLTIANARGHNFVGKLIRSLRKSFDGGETSGARTRTSFDVGQNRTASSRVYGNRGAAEGQEYSSPSQEKRSGEAPVKPAKTQKAENGQPREKGAGIMEIAGWLVGIFGAFITLRSMGGGLWAVLSGIAIILGGGALIWTGWKKKQQEKAFKRCFTVSGSKGVVRIRTLAQTLGIGEEELEKQLQEMIDRGYYGERAYVDHARKLLVIEPEQMRDVYRAEDEARAAGKTAEARKDTASSLSEYDRIIEQIRVANEHIADEKMSEKIRTMQEITAAIFQEVETNPAKKTQIQRFMNYYLPTTLKLLDSYARIEQQGVSGENMAKAKADIERIADTLVEGYRKQLDTLYRSEAVDIAGDVSVIENMMRRDGLTGKDDFHIRTPAEEPAASVSPGAAQAEEGQVLGGH